MFFKKKTHPPKFEPQLSLSDNLSYPAACLAAAFSQDAFDQFRRNPSYQEVLEHASPEQGRECLTIFSSNQRLMERMIQFKKNDLYGNPQTWDLPPVGSISPTTIRYIKVLHDLELLFGQLEGQDICEIGVGYGGQCRLIDVYFHPLSYSLVDIKPALLLAQKYLDNFVLNTTLLFKTMNELRVREYDLVISNYAFSELNRELQNMYLKKVILPSKKGYITHNSITPAGYQSYTAEELLKIIPGSSLRPEEPLTYPNNCIIVWGQNEFPED